MKCSPIIKAVFGAKAQVAVGVLFTGATLFQAWLWGIHTKPSATGIFWLSIEALLFASYGVVATGLGFRATERVEEHVVNLVDSDES